MPLECWMGTDGMKEPSFTRMRTAQEAGHLVSVCLHASFLHPRQLKKSSPVMLTRRRWMEGESGQTEMERKMRQGLGWYNDDHSVLGFCFLRSSLLSAHTT